MESNEEIRWKGEVSRRYKDIENIAIGVLIAISSTFGIFFFPYYYFELFGRITSVWIHIGIHFLLGLVVIGLILLVYALISNTVKDLYPKFFVTPDKLVLKEWTFWRKSKVKTFNLKEVNTIYIVEDAFSERGSFWFYAKTAEEILGQCPKDMVDFAERNKVTPLDCFFGFDFEFMSVNSPILLFKMIETLIPLKQHPKYPNVFQRINDQL